MLLTKENVIEVLKEVVYFPKGGNIIELGMIDNLNVEDGLVKFNIIVDDVEDDKNNFLVNSATKYINDAFGDVKVEASLMLSKTNPLAGIKHIIGVASGKGGVGKSTVAMNLAVGLAMQGMKVGLLDTDIYGPSVPIMSGTENTMLRTLERDGKTFMVPIEKFGVKMLSIGHLVSGETPLIWRGPMAASALNQLMTETEWGELDFLVLDMPPGTGDIQLSLAQNYKLSGAVIVTTPQKVAFADVRRAANMFTHSGIEVPVLGLVENMAYFTPSDMPEKKYYIFGQGHGEEFAKELGVPFLGQIPMDENVASAGDKGTPFSFNGFSPVTAAFEKLAKTIIERI